jgi:hypothetical protein
MGGGRASYCSPAGLQQAGGTDAELSRCEVEGNCVEDDVVVARKGAAVGCEVAWHPLCVTAVRRRAAIRRPTHIVGVARCQRRQRRWRQLQRHSNRVLLCRRSKGVGFTAHVSRAGAHGEPLVVTRVGEARMEADRVPLHQRSKGVGLTAHISRAAGFGEPLVATWAGTACSVRRFWRIVRRCGWGVYDSAGRHSGCSCAVLGRCAGGRSSLSLHRESRRYAELMAHSSSACISSRKRHFGAAGRASSVATSTARASSEVLRLRTTSFLGSRGLGRVLRVPSRPADRFASAAGRKVRRRSGGVGESPRNTKPDARRFGKGLSRPDPGSRTTPCR